jgi:hypothetical protein
MTFKPRLLVLYVCMWMWRVIGNVPFQPLALPMMKSRPGHEIICFKSILTIETATIEKFYD